MDGVLLKIAMAVMLVGALGQLAERGKAWLASAAAQRLHLSIMVESTARHCIRLDLMVGMDRKLTPCRD